MLGFFGTVGMTLMPAHPNPNLNPNIDPTPKLTLTLDPLFGPNLSPILYFNPNPLSKLTRGFLGQASTSVLPFGHWGPPGGCQIAGFSFFAIFFDSIASAILINLF